MRMIRQIKVLPRLRPKLWGIGLLMGAQLFLAVSHTFAKLATHSVPLSQITTYRYAIPLIGMWGWMVISHRSVAPIRNFMGSFSWLLVVRGVLGTGSLFCLLAAFKVGAISRVAFLNATSCMWALCLSAVFLKERLRPLVVVAMLTGLWGIYLICHPESGGIGMADGFAIASAITTAFIAISLKSLRRVYSSRDIVMGFYLVGLVLSLPFAIRHGVRGLDEAGWYMVGVAGFGVLGQWCLSESFRYLQAAIVSGLSMCGVLFFLISGMLVFNESFSGMEWMGSAILLGSLIVIAFRS